ncbi:hypothetical protein ACQVP2_29435 [Methylobacterium aquaticum]|uniref:hypothetical protein n=1 Tax=Methylobacterium aquaticum TaxID=270351 RepID=UPI003D178967
MIASAAPTSSIKSAPKAPDPARRHYVSLAWRLRAALAEARATSTDPEALEDLAARFADARSMAARARAWGQRADRRARLAPARPVPAGRRRKRNMRAQPVTAREREIQVANGSVPDPYDPKRFTTVPMNRRVDLLAQERSTGRITEAQFTVGRMIQAVYERGSGARLGSPSFEPRASRDQTVARELAVIYALEDANRVTRFTARLERAIGAIGVRFLRAILAEGHTFASYAMARGKAGERGAAQIGAHFRFLLEGLTEAQHTARGPDRPTPRDVYREQADGLAARLARLRADDEADVEHEDDGTDERLEEEFREMLAEAD